jgi:mono/diheme cytochrome c family protein
VAQQHSYTEAEINAGSKLFESNCGSCHGENGDKIVGIDFSKGLFKTAKTDEDLIRIFRNGVPTPACLPIHSMENQAGNLVAYVRSMVGGARTVTAVATNLAGDAARGKAFMKAREPARRATPLMASVRKASGSGSPARRTWWRRRSAAASGGWCGGGEADAVPLPLILSNWNARLSIRAQRLQRNTASFKRYRKTIRQHGNAAQSRHVLHSNAGCNDKLVSFLKSDLKEFGFQPSAMPSFKGKLTPQEIADVVSYLVSLRSN